MKRLSPSEQNSPYLSPPWREQFSPAEEARQAAYEREEEMREEFALYDLEPDHDPDDDYPAAA